MKTLADIAKERRKYLKAICSDNLANYLSYTNLFSESELRKILNIALKIAKKKNHLRVWLEDFAEARRLIEK